MPLQDVTELEAGQESDYAAVLEVLAAVEDQVEELEVINITADARRAKIQQIRDEAVEKVKDRLLAARDRVKRARALASEFEFANFRRSAMQGAAAELAPHVVLWSALPTRELLRHLSDVVAVNNIAAAEAIRGLYMQRADRDMRAFAEIFGKLKLPVEQVNQSLRNVSSKGALIEASVIELMRGRRNIVRELDAMRSGSSIGRRD